MTEKYITYKIDGKIYDVPESESAIVEAKFPSASIEMRMGDRVFDVPLSQKQNAISKYGQSLSYIYEKGGDSGSQEPSFESTDAGSLDEPMSRKERKQARRAERWEKFEEKAVAANDSLTRAQHGPAINASEAAMSSAAEATDKPSWGESFIKGAGAGFTRAGKGLADALHVLSSGMLYNDPETGAAKRLDDYETQMFDETNTFRNASILAGETADRLSKEADPTGGEKGFVDLISEGKIGLALQKGLSTGAESLPMTLSAYNPYTMALNMLSMAGGNYAEQTLENPEIDKWKRATYAIGSAALEQAVEKFADPVFKYIGGGKGVQEISEDVAKELIERGTKEATEGIASRIVRVIKNTAKDAGGEGLEEVVTSLGTDTLGQALDWIDGDKDYGFTAQWEQMKEENPDADLGDFALNKAKEYMDSFIGGALSGTYMSGTMQTLSEGVNAHYDSKAQKAFNESYNEGRDMDIHELYDVDGEIKEANTNVSKAFTDSEGNAAISNDFIESLSAEDAFALSRSKELSKEQRESMWSLSMAKAKEQGLNQRLDEVIAERIDYVTAPAKAAAEDGRLSIAMFGNRMVYVRGAYVRDDGTLSIDKDAPKDGPVWVIDSEGDDYLVNSNDLYSASAVNADDYISKVETAIRDGFMRQREEIRKTMSPKAKSKAVESFFGRKMYVNFGNGICEVEVQQVMPQSGEVQIKGKKGDLNGQSIIRVPIEYFYDSIAKDDAGTPMFADAMDNAPIAQPSETTPAPATATAVATAPAPAPSTAPEFIGDVDFRDYVGEILIDGVPTAVEVTQQDNPSNTVTYTYIDANGNRKSGSTSIDGFRSAVQQAEQFNGEPQQAPAPAQESIDGTSPAPVADMVPAETEVAVPASAINWDVLLEQDPDAYIAEMQKRFGDKTVNRVNAVIAATQRELDALSKTQPKTQEEIFENEDRKEALQNKIDVLNGMVTRLTAMPAAPVTPAAPTAPVTPTAPVSPVTPAAPTAPIEPNVPDFSSDRASDARDRGYRITNGQRVDRRGETGGAYGNDIEISFTSDSKGKRSGKIKVIDAGNLVPSHISGAENVEHFLPEAQPKKRTDRDSAVSASLIAQNMNNPQMTTVTTSAYEGAPIVNKRGEVIQGNNRSAAILEMYQAHQQKAAEYKQYLIDHASEFGLDANEVAAMQNPVLVRELDVDDSDAINLGQYTMQDMESGGNQSIDSGRAVAGLNNKDMMNYFIETLLAEENDDSSDMNISDLITRNGNAALRLLYAQGIINQTQYQSAIGPDGRVTADARASLRGIIEQQLFAGGIDNLSIMFEVLPDKAKKAIMQTIAKDVKNMDGERVIPYIQQAIEIYYHLNQQKDFVSAKTDDEIKAAIEGYKLQRSFDESLTPVEKYSNFAFELAFLFKARNQKEIRGKFNALYDAMSGEATLFAADGEGKSLAEAIQEVYGITLNIGNYETNGQGGANVLGSGDGRSPEGGQGSNGDVGEGPDAGEGGQRTSDGGADSSVVGGPSGQGSGQVNVPVAPVQVANPIDEARKKERQLSLNLKKVGLSPEAKQDLAFNAGKSVADMFATREEYDTYAETAADFGAYNTDFEKGVNESFANRQQNAGISQGNSVPLEGEPNVAENGEQGEAPQGEGSDGQDSGNTGGGTNVGGDQSGNQGDSKRKPKQSGSKGKGGKTGNQIASKYPARKGNATQKLLVDTFGFNSVTIPNSRKDILNSIYDFMMEMAKTLGISPKSIGQGGWLDIENLRGNSTSSAQHILSSKIADQTVVKAAIKLKYARLSGIAHEWWHALDHALSYFNTGRGKIVASEIPSSRFTGRQEVWDAVQELVRAIESSGHADRMRSLNVGIRYKNYLLENTEMIARAFEQYIQSKFAAAGISISGVVETDFFAQPTAEEMEVIAPAFEHLFAVLQEKEGKTPGTSVLFQIGDEMSPNSNSRSLTNEAITISLNESGIEEEIVSDEQAEQMRKLSGANTDPEVEFMVSPDKPVFVSNAARVVEGLKQEKATPEQWLKMIEKAGGLKAGEDKWMGLSEWLKSSDKKTLTKAEVLDFINENMIVIEEQHYGEMDEETREFVTDNSIINMYGISFRDSFNTAFVIEENFRGEWYVDVQDYEEAVSLYNEHNEDKITIVPADIEYESREETLLKEWATSVLKNAEQNDGVKPIDTTRMSYTTDGLTNLHEIALTAPTIESWNKEDEVHFGDAGDGRAVAWIRFGETEVTVQDATQQRLNEIYDRLVELEMKVSSDGITMEEYEERARLREERDRLQEIEPNTQKVLVIDEIQSKRHQEGRESGYRSTIEKASADYSRFMERMHKKYDFDSSTPFVDVFNKEELDELYRLDRARTNAYFMRGIPDAPFDKNWHELAMKRMLRYAAENGYDVIAWTKGEQQAERYEIGGIVDYINVEQSGDEKVVLIRLSNGGVIENFVNSKGEITQGPNYGNKLSEVLGKDLAEQILSSDETYYDGGDLKVGGEGMKGFYDKMLPAFVNKYGKKWGIKVSDITLPHVEKAGRVMHSVPVTQDMKDSVLDGQTMFMKRPNGTVYGWTDGKKIYTTKAGFNPNTRIHEYTHIWAKAMMQKNPKGWQSIKDLLRGTPVWNEVMNDVNYSSIHSNEDMVASEVLSRISGTENAAKLEQMEQQMVAEAKGTMRKLEARGLIQRIKDALNEFWNWVGTELFGIESFESVEQVTDRVLWDLMNATDLGELSEGQVEASIIPDGDLKTKLQKEIDNGEYITLYRAVRKINGKYYSPKMSKLGGVGQEIVLGQLEQSDERPDLAYPVQMKDGSTKYKVNLDGSDPAGTGLKSRTTAGVDYNPYIHASDSMMNDQFTAAFAMPEMTVIEVRVPKSELTSGYHAQYAADHVGLTPWKSGTVDKRLSKDEQRNVYLSRYDMPVREVPTEEIADHIAAKLLRNGLSMPYNLVTPQVAEALIRRGVDVSEKPSGTVPAGQDEQFKALKERVLSESGVEQNNLVSLPKVSRAIKSGEWTKDAINELNKTVEDVEEGKAILKRYTSSELTGLLEGGRLLVGASIISRGSQGNVLKSGERIGSLEERAEETIPALTAWAKKIGVWREYSEKTQEEISHSYITSGGEAQVFYLGDGKVEKIIGLDYFVDPQLAVDRIAIHNSLFEETSLKVTGFGTNKDGNFAIIVEQPTIIGKHTDNAEIDSYIESIGFKKVDDTTRTFANEELYLSDLHEENVLNQEHKRYYVIDGDFRLNTPEAGIGGTREIDNSLVRDNDSLLFRSESNPITPEMEEIKRKAIADGTFMKAPNGQPTKLNERQWLQVRTKNFINWFGDWINDPENASKIIDENGEPMVMYHGSAWQPLSETEGNAVFKMNDGMLGNGAYFSSNLSEATLYAEIATDLDMTEGDNYEILQDEFVTDYFLNIRNEKDIYQGGDSIIAVAKSPSQIKSATDNVGTFDAENPDIRFRSATNPITPEMDAEYMAAVESGDMETAQRMVDEAAVAAGYTIRGEHGRVSKFTIFDREKANPEGNWGKGFYFTNNFDDAEYNYGSVDGPDLQAKIDREVERRANNAYYDDVYEDEDAIREAVEKEFITDEPNVVSAAIKMDNPFVVGHGKVEIGEDGLGNYDMQETYLTVEYETDEEGEIDYDSEPTGTLVDLVDALNEELSNYEWSRVNASEILYNNFDGMTASQFEQEARELLDMAGITDESGDYIMTSEIIRAAIERAGFDGIIDNTVNQKFGDARRYGQSMTGVNRDTRHYIAFESSQIKDTDPVTYDDAGNVIPLSERFNPENSDIRYRKSYAQNAAVDYLVGDARRAAIEHAVNQEAEKLGVTVTYKTREEMPRGHKNDKGYFNTKTGEIVICTENAASISDAIQTILHEAVAHKGLRALMGDRFDEFISRVYDSLDAETKAKVDALAESKHNGNTAVAMEEYMASLAESMDFANSSVWDKVKAIFNDIINAILGRNDVRIGDNELRYILRASYNNMANPRGMESVRGWAQDQMMREEYKINEASPEILSRTGIDPTEMSRQSARLTYDRVVADDWQEFQRQFQDAMQPVRIAIDAIQQETGNIPIEDYENYILIQNQASSRSRVEIDEFATKYYSPIIEQINGIIDQMLESRGFDKNDKVKRSEAYAEIRQYLIAKHGLERNEYYQATKKRKLKPWEKRKAIKEAQDEYDNEVNSINSDTSLTDDERAEKLNEAKDIFDATLVEIEEREVPDIRDYSGLTSLFGLEPKAFKEAEEKARMLVDSFESQIEDGAEALWKKINAATDKTLRHSYESGLLSRQQYNDIKSMFSFYIPLRGFDETTAEDVYAYARFEGNRFNSVIQSAEGRTSVADDPIAIIMNMAESEIAQGNKNRAKQALYNYLLNRHRTDGSGNQTQNSLMQIEDVWYIVSTDRFGNEVHTIASPDHEAGETYEEFDARMASLAAEEKAYKSKKGQVDVGMRFQKQMNRNAHYIYLKVNGVDKAIYVNGDPKAADAVNGSYRPQPGSAESALRTINRFLSSTFTNYSLEFTARNYFRDMFYSHINIDIKESDASYRKKFRQNWRHNNLVSMLRMLSAFRAGEYDGRSLTEDEAAFVEFMNNGGQTGYTVINSVERHKKNLERAIKNIHKGIDKGGVKDSTIFRYTLGAIELLNEASELVTRFAAFKTSRDMGRSINKSIGDAKEITVNFNTKGAQDGKGWMGAISHYFGWSKFFFNASVQGVQNIKAMADANKLKFCSTVGIMAAAGFLMPILTAAVTELLGGDDDENFYWNIPEYERQNNLCVVVGDRYAKIPLPIGFREMYAIGDMVSAMIFDKKFSRDVSQVGTDIANKISSILLPINPLESQANGLSIWHTMAYTLSPSSAQFLIQNTTNVDWKGAPLQKEYTYNENDPQWMKAYASNPDWMVGLSKWCNEHINLDEDYKGLDWSPEKLDNTLSNLFGGIYSLIKKTGRSITSVWNKEDRNLSNIPLAGVVMGSKVSDDERFINGAYYDEKDFYDKQIGYIKRTIKPFGYSLEDVFKRVPAGEARTGEQHPKMQDVYGNKNFDFMQEWYLGHEGDESSDNQTEKDGLKKIERDIEKLEKKIIQEETPNESLLQELSDKRNEFETFRRGLVDDLLELD